MISKVVLVAYRSEVSMGNTRVLVIDEENAMVEAIGNGLQEAGIAYTGKWHSIARKCSNVSRLFRRMEEVGATGPRPSRTRKNCALPAAVR